MTGAGILTPAAPPVLRGLDGRTTRALLASPAARAGLTMAAVLLVAAVVGPWVLPDPDLPDYTRQLAPPSPGNLLGTDHAGRDLLARSVAGARSSLGAAVAVMVLSAVVGIVVGTLAGAVGGALDTVLTRATDVMLGLPTLVLTLAVVGVLGPGHLNLVLAMVVTSWASLARLARSVAQGARHRPDVVAARMAGVGPVRAVLTHVVPGVTAQVSVAATLGLGDAVLLLAGLSFLGLGAQPPTAEWGTMLAAGRETFAFAPWQLIGPGAGLVLAVAAATLVSDALRDVTDPRGHR